MRAHALALVRFSSVSLFCFALGIGVLTGLHELLHVHYLLAYVASFIVTSSLGYFLNGRYTFRANNTGASGVIRYFSVNIFLLIINGAALRILVEHFHQWYLTSTLGLAVINTPVSYLAHRIVSYRMGRPSSATAVRRKAA